MRWWRFGCRDDAAIRWWSADPTSGSGLGGGPLLAACSTDHPTLLFGGAAPDAGVLVGAQRELGQAIGVALLADIFGVLDLFDRQTGGADGEEQARVGVATACILSPVNTAGKSVSGQCHECPPRIWRSGRCPGLGPILGTGSAAGRKKVGTGSSFRGQLALRLFFEDTVPKVVLIAARVPKKWKTVPMAPAPTVIAHRGAREAARENTLPAFRLAREFGAEWVELDARRTADGVVVVHHDAQLADGRVLAELTVESGSNSSQASPKRSRSVTAWV